MQYQIIKDSGLYQKDELEAILGVSRMSIHKYFTGKARPRKVVTTRLIKLTTIIESLTQKGLLPFNRYTDKHKRVNLVAKLQEILNA